MIILQNNKFRSDARVSVTGDVARGYGVFETLRTYGDKKLPLLQRHLDRLFVSADKIGLKARYSKKEIAKMVERVVEKSFFKIQRVKILAFSKDLIVISVPAKIKTNIYNGVALENVKMMRTLPEIKSISYLPSFLAHEKAVKKGFFDAVLVNDKEEVTEGSYSNVFWFEGNDLCTREKDIFPGMVREILLKHTSYKIKFKNIKIEDLKKKEEVFITQSINLIVPVVRIDDKKIGEGLVGQRTKKIMKEFDDFIEKITK